MLGQQLAVAVLLPIAVTALLDDLFAEGDYYPGDLLRTVITLPPAAWSPVLAQCNALASALTSLPTDLDNPALETAVAEFLSR